MGVTRHQQKFTREGIVDYAILNDPATISLSHVAGRFGVSNPSIYRVVFSPQDLRRYCAMRAAREMETGAAAAFEDSWRTGLEYFARQAWTVCAAYPGIAEVFLTLPAAKYKLDEALARIARTALDKDFPGTLLEAKRIIGVMIGALIQSRAMIDAARRVDTYQLSPYAVHETPDPDRLWARQCWIIEALLGDFTARENSGWVQSHRTPQPIMKYKRQLSRRQSSR